MRDTMRKLLYAGIGVFSITREKAEQVINELVDKGQVSREEAQDMVDDLVKKGEEERENIRQSIKEEIANASQNIGLVTRKEFNELKNRVEALEQLIQGKNNI